MFSYGIVVCEMIGQVKADPEALPRLPVRRWPLCVCVCVCTLCACEETLSLLSLPLPLPSLSASPSPLPLLLSHFSMQNFGLDVENFRPMIKECPLTFFDLAVRCCNLDAEKRPSFQVAMDGLSHLLRSGEQAMMQSKCSFYEIPGLKPASPLSSP